MTEIQSQEELSRCLDRLAQQPDHHYHKIPQGVKNKITESLQRQYVLDALDSVHKELYPEKHAKSESGGATTKKTTRRKKDPPPTKVGDLEVSGNSTD